MGFNERFLVIDDHQAIGDMVIPNLEKAGFGHVSVGQLFGMPTVDEINGAQKRGMTVALVDGSFGSGGLGKGGCADGREAARLIRRHAPGTVIIAFTDQDEELADYGDYCVSKRDPKSLRKLISIVTEIPRPQSRPVSGQ